MRCATWACRALVRRNLGTRDASVRGGTGACRRIGGVRWMDGHRMRGCLGAAAVAVLTCASLAVAADDPNASNDPTLADRWRTRKFLTNPDEGRYVPVLSGSTFNE